VAQHECKNQNAIVGDWRKNRGYGENRLSRTAMRFTKYR